MFLDTDYEQLTSCPWCESSSQTDWGTSVRGFKAVKCKTCDCIYIRNRLNKNGLIKYYDNYLSSVHQASASLNDQRQRMYKIEFDFINSYCKEGKVLDVGCSGGYFLEYFQKAGYDCHGVEFGNEAALEASKKFEVYNGDFTDYSTDNKYDLIIFRGVLEHIPYPKSYLSKAIELLDDKAFIYITSTPNAESICCKIFEEQWNQHEPEAHLIHFSPTHFDDFFQVNGFERIAAHYFYEETPYARMEQDILEVAKAIDLKKQNVPIDFKSPAFYGSMMTLIYQKDN